jgi:hypothetical protein
MTLVGAVLVLTGLSVGLASLVALHFLPTGMSPLRNAVSQYGITAYRTGYQAQTIAYALAGAGAAFGVGALPGPVGVVVICCAVFAVAMTMALVAMVLSRWSSRRYFGAIERAFYALMTAWLGAVAVLLVA